MIVCAWQISLLSKEISVLGIAAFWASVLIELHHKKRKNREHNNKVLEKRNFFTAGNHENFLEILYKRCGFEVVNKKKI